MSEIFYDLAIIGAGPGGYHAAIRAAQYGAKVALIEKDKLGGTCLNRGCIPTKALYASVQSIDKLKDFEDLGIEIKEYTLNFKKAVERKNRVVEELVGGIAALEKAWKNDLYYGHGQIIGGDISSGYDILIRGQEKKKIRAKRVLLATGSSPALIPSFNIDHEKILTSDDILDPNFITVPDRLLIIGAGVIGCEFANIFASFGSKVTMLEYLGSPIATEEPMIVKELVKKFNKSNIEIKTSQNVLSVENTGSSVKVITCSASVPRDQIENAEKLIFEADICLVSIGRMKESKDLGLEELGIKTDRGAIKCNVNTLETSVKGIYAIGDVTGGLMLAHVAYHEADVAVANALASIGGFPVKETKTDYNTVPATIFTSPNIGSVGVRRKAAKDRGLNILMGQFPYSSLGKAKCMGEEEGFIVTLAEKDTYKIIGASCIGVEASELIAELALAIKHGLTIHDVAETIHSHPTISEMVLESSEAAIGKAIHKKGRPIYKP
ncbi:MAG: dihydrolipoyl dehydrogenase [Candidatus Lokiarchaeota archaeon]|nr:dihydrolipoyl dehydrogenase [Candidatus Lokiarchaeota archaeon]